MVGNHSECKGIRGLTARPTSRAGSKDGLSDPVVPHGRAIAQRIKATPGITGLSPQEFTSTGRFGTSIIASWGCSRSQGWAVRPLKRYASWVQNVVRQFGPYPSCRKFERSCPSTRGPGWTYPPVKSCQRHSWVCGRDKC